MENVIESLFGSPILGKDGLIKGVITFLPGRLALKVEMSCTTAILKGDYSESMNCEYPCAFTDTYHPLRFTNKHFCALAYGS